MNEFIYKYKCNCNTKTHTLTYGMQTDKKVKKKIDIETPCPFCNKKIKLVKILQILEGDKKVEKEIGIT